MPQAGRARVLAGVRRGQGTPQRETGFGAKMGKILRISLDGGQSFHSHHPR